LTKRDHGFPRIRYQLTSPHPEIDDFRMDHSAFSGQQSAKDVVFMRFFLKAESEMLIALIKKYTFPAEH
jgi:hypothetical protein